MSRFGTPTQKTSASKFSAPSSTANKPMFEAPTAKASNPFFKTPSDDNDKPLFGTPTSIDSSSRFGEPSDPTKANGKDGSGFLLFDNPQHSSDGAGQPMDGRYSSDEAANVYKEIEALGHDITTTDATDAATLETLLAEVATFLLPEAEGGSGFPDGDTVFNFVESGGNLLFFGGTGVNGAQLDYINNTFDLSLTGAYGATYVTHNLNKNGVDGAFSDFLDGPDTLYGNDGSSYLGIDSLPDGATVIYGREAEEETILAAIPSGDGQVIFIGWDFFNSFNNDGGWDDAFATVADLTAETEAVIVGTSQFGQPNAVDAGDLFQGV